MDNNANVAIRFTGITKRFPGVLAVDDASLVIRRGEVHSIVGGNGAGKSTLMKVLAGVYPVKSYEGVIYMDDKPCEFKSILDAQNQGIMMIPQDIHMANDLSIAENLFMGDHPTKHGVVDYYTMYSKADVVLKDFRLDLDPSTKVREIGIAQKQLIVIARAMMKNARILLLDEPTSTLSDKECDTLFEKIRELTAMGVACVFISHRLEEVRRISDVITIMRDGRIVETAPIEEMPERRIVSLMVGREMEGAYPSHSRQPGEVLLRVKHVTIHDPKVPENYIVKDVAFDIRRGEILSMYGLVGAGRSETALAMLGAFQGAVECEMELDGKPFQVLSPHEAVTSGIGYLPEDRKAQGVVDINTVANNITIPSLSRISNNGVVNQTLEHEMVEGIIDRLAIKTPGPQTLVRNLSGGNAQKCVLGRWMAAGSDVMILDEATQGIDVDTKFQIYVILDELARQGKAILWISSDLSEVMGISDRILTMKNGKVINVTEIDKADRMQIIWEAATGKVEAE